KIDPNTGKFCSATCKFEQCGNGVTDSDIGEICDDGNTVGGDGCAADCKSTELCGNHKLDQPFKDGNGAPDLNDPRNEVGDDGNRIPAPANDRHARPRETASCNIDCTPAACGDGKVNHSFHPDLAPQDRTEQCDDGPGNNKDSADCTAGCQVNVCGDGLQDTEGNHREGCDDGNRDDRDACSNACVLASCGDGIVGPGEDCDLGKDSNGNSRNTDGSACPG